MGRSPQQTKLCCLGVTVLQAEAGGIAVFVLWFFPGLTRGAKAERVLRAFHVLDAKLDPGSSVARSGGQSSGLPSEESCQLLAKAGSAARGAGGMAPAVPSGTSRLLPGQLVFDKGGRARTEAGAGVAGGESLSGWSRGNDAAGTGAEKVPRRQLRRRD